MDQIKSLITPSKFKVWVRHVESHTRDERDKDDVIGVSYLKGIWDKKAHAYQVTKFHVHPEFRNQGYQIDLFRAALELLSSHHKKLISDDVITSNQRKHIDQVIQQGHVRKDLPFGDYLLDSPRRTTMSKIAKTSENPQYPTKRRNKVHRPKLTRQTQGFIWSLGDALTRALREPQGGQTGDNRFWVSGLSKSAWAIKHPDLEILESGESPLILRIKKVGEGQWRVEGQNQLQNLKNTEIISVENTPPTPNKTWELDYIAARAADYFLDQKEKILNLKQAMSPQQAPGAGAPPAPPGGGEAGGAPPGGGLGGGGMPPMASRRARATLANLHKAQEVVTGLEQRYGSEKWFNGARVANDRAGVGIVVRLARSPRRSLRASLGGIPVEWVSPSGRRIAAGSEEAPQEESHETLVNKVYKYILSRKRHFSSPRYLALKLKKDLGVKVSVPQLVKAIGELMAQDLIDFSARKFKPVLPAVKPKEDLVAIRSSSSMYEIDKGNWRHNDQLDTTYNDEILTRDAPEEENNSYSRIMPDPTKPN